MTPAAPELRFPEFKEPWKPGHAGDAFKNSRAKGAAGLPIYSVTMDRGLVRRDSMERHMAADAADGQNLRAQRGDIVYNMMRMWQGAVGLAHEECMVSPAYVVLSPKKHASSEFFDQWFTAKRMLYLLWAYSQGITSDRLRLYARDFARIPLHLPPLPEQQKIAAFLGAVDAKLAALGARQAALGRFKAGLMQKLFSQQLRFTQDDGKEFPDWQEKRLGDLLTVRYGKDHKGLPKGDIPVFGTGGVMRHVDRALHSGPSVLIGRKGTIDQPRFVTSPFWTVDTLFYSDIKQGFLPFFVYLVVQSINWLKFNEATGVPSLSVTAIHGVKVTVPPHPDEQQKIADALSAMDARIAAVAEQIAKLERFKKGLLQQMFV